MNENQISPQSQSFVPPTAADEAFQNLQNTFQVKAQSVRVDKFPGGTYSRIASDAANRLINSTYVYLTAAVMLAAGVSISGLYPTWNTGMIDWQATYIARLAAAAAQQ
jgi:hypothetical protein